MEWALGASVMACLGLTAGVAWLWVACTTARRDLADAERRADRADLLSAKVQEEYQRVLSQLVVLARNRPEAKPGMPLVDPFAEDDRQPDVWMSGSGLDGAAMMETVERKG